MFDYFTFMFSNLNKTTSWRQGNEKTLFKLRIFIQKSTQALFRAQVIFFPNLSRRAFPLDFIKLNAFFWIGKSYPVGLVICFFLEAVQNFAYNALVPKVWVLITCFWQVSELLEGAKTSSSKHWETSINYTEKCRRHS